MTLDTQLKQQRSSSCPGIGSTNVRQSFSVAQYRFGSQQSSNWSNDIYTFLGIDAKKKIFTDKTRLSMDHGSKQSQQQNGTNMIRILGADNNQSSNHSKNEGWILCGPFRLCGDCNFSPKYWIMPTWQNEFFSGRVKIARHS